MRHGRTWSALVAVTASLALAAACERSRSAEPASSCGPEDSSTPCLLAAARTALDEVAGDADWVAAAVEYAEALSASNQRQDAAAILELAETRAVALEDTKARATALVEVGTALAHNGSTSEALRIAGLGEALLPLTEDGDRRVNLHGKLLSLRAGAGQTEGALAAAVELPQETPAQASFKARTLREIAVHQAEAGDFETVAETLDAITMGLTYYQSTARSDVAHLALAAGHGDLAETLLREAQVIALAQDNGYFLAGAVRDIGTTYALSGDIGRAMPLFETAKEAARTAATPQERGRALSRIATKLADCRQFDRAVEVLPEARETAALEENETMRHYAFYEIAGAAAFAGDFETAFALLDELPATPFGSAASLASAAQRDVAWGLTRHGRPADAIDLAKAIATPRERVQALSRMVRLQEEPEMKALPRYL